MIYLLTSGHLGDIVSTSLPWVIYLLTSGHLGDIVSTSLAWVIYLLTNGHIGNIVSTSHEKVINSPDDRRHLGGIMKIIATWVRS